MDKEWGICYTRNMKKPCLICKKKFYARPFLIKKGGGKFCSYKCRSLSVDVRNKISNTLKKKGIKPPSRKGAKMSEDSKRKIGDFFRGKKLSRKHIRKIVKAKKGLLGRKKTEEERKKISETLKRIGHKPPIGFGFKKGRKHLNWKGGITPIEKRLRYSKEAILWRKSVFERDNYTCQRCGQRGGKLNADHIKPWSLFKKLRYIIDNGRTLCVGCHKKIGWRGSHIKICQK